MRSLIIFLSLVLSAGCAWAQAEDLYREYRLGPMDVVSVDIQGEDELAGDYRVTAGGVINLPFYGPVEVRGLTEGETAQAIAEVLGEYLLRPVVRARIVEFNSKPISVLGAVNEPGKLDVPGPISLLNAVVEAGGLAETAGSTLTVVRRADNGLTASLTVPVDALQAGEPRYDIPVVSNDIITVSAVDELYIYLQGSVEMAGRQEWTDGNPITLAAAIARAGGPSDRASSKVIVRRPTAGGLEEIRVDLREQPDFLLHNGDVVEVKESFF